MTTVYTENVECPVCRANTAHTDVDIHSYERDINCVRCGFYSLTEGVERAGGKLFWEATYEWSPEVSRMVADAGSRTHWLECEGIRRRGGRMSANDKQSTKMQLLVDPGPMPEGEKIAQQYPARWTDKQIFAEVGRNLDHSGSGTSVDSKRAGR